MRQSSMSLGWAEGVVEGEDVELVRKSPTLGTVGDLRYIYAANDFTALQFLGQLAYSEAVERYAGNEFYYGLGGLVSLDLNKRTGHPVGLALGYKYTTIPEGGDDIVDRHPGSPYRYFLYREGLISVLASTWNSRGFRSRELKNPPNSSPRSYRCGISSRTASARHSSRPSSPAQAHLSSPDRLRPRRAAGGILTRPSS